MALDGTPNLTPAMKQYAEIKKKYSDCILFYRMGDFYEMFFQDALTAAPILEITLTSRNKSKEGAVPLCGVPYHAASAYINKLVEKGLKDAVHEVIWNKIDKMEGSGGGVICIDRFGNIVMDFNTHIMYRAWAKASGESGAAVN